jgi:hypothetical protein
MTIPATLNSPLIAYKYSDFQHSFTSTSNLETGYTYYSEIRVKSSSSTKIGTFIITVDNTVLSMSLTRSDLEIIPIGTYRWDIKRVNNLTNFEDIIIIGEIIIKEAVTQLP